MEGPHMPGRQQRKDPSADERFVEDRNPEVPWGSKRAQTAEKPKQMGERQEQQRSAVEHVNELFDDVTKFNDLDTKLNALTTAGEKYLKFVNGSVVTLKEIRDRVETAHNYAKNLMYKRVHPPLTAEQANDIDSELAKMGVTRSPLSGGRVGMRDCFKKCIENEL